MSANNEMLQDPAVLMTSKNPSLTGGARSRARYNAGQELIKSLLSDVSQLTDVLNQSDSATQTTTRVNKQRRRTPRKKHVKSPQSKQQQDQSTEIQSPSQESQFSDFSTVAQLDQENRSPQKKRRNGKPSNDGRTFKPSNKSNNNNNNSSTSPRTPEPKSQKSEKSKSASARPPLETSFRLLNQSSSQRQLLYKPMIAHNSMANIAPYRRFPISQNPFAQGRYVSDLNPFAQSFIPVQSFTVPKPGTSNEFVSRQISDYYQRNRQSNEQFKSKQIMRQGLESILKHGFPHHIINLYMVGSSTNGIGDNGSSVDICIVARKRPLASIGSSSPSPANPEAVTSTATSTTNDELEVQSSENLPSVSVDSTASTASFETASSQVEPSSNQENETKEEAKPEAVQESAQEKPQDDPVKEVKEEAKESDAVQLVVELPPVEQSSTENQGEPSQDVANEANKAQQTETSESEMVSEQPTQVSEPVSTGEVTDLSLDMIEKFLQSKNFAKDIVSIPAKVPIIKFKDDITKLSITLNLNQEVSIRNTQLIRDYAKLDWRFPHLALIMKQWAKENRINNALEKGVSNYSWTLMVVHFLQVVDPPVLPCLQKMIPRRYNQNNIEQAVRNWRRYPAKWRSNNTMNLRQLLKAMFRYYGYVFTYDQHVISVREGKALERSDGFAGSEDHHSQWNSFLCIEEPFTRTNTARSVHDKEKFDRVIELFRMSSNALRGVRISLFSVLADDINSPITY